MPFLRFPVTCLFIAIVVSVSVFFTLLHYGFNPQTSVRHGRAAAHPMLRVGGCGRDAPPTILIPSHAASLAGLRAASLDDLSRSRGGKGSNGSRSSTAEGSVGTGGALSALGRVAQSIVVVPLRLCALFIQSLIRVLTATTLGELFLSLALIVSLSGSLELALGSPRYTTFLLEIIVFLALYDVVLVVVGAYSCHGVHLLPHGGADPDASQQEPLTCTLGITGWVSYLFLFAPSVSIVPLMLTLYLVRSFLFNPIIAVPQHRAAPPGSPAEDLGRDWEGAVNGPDSNSFNIRRRSHDSHTLGGTFSAPIPRDSTAQYLDQGSSWSAKIRALLPLPPPPPYRLVHINKPRLLNVGCVSDELNTDTDDNAQGGARSDDVVNASTGAPFKCCVRDYASGIAGANLLPIINHVFWYDYHGGPQSEEFCYEARQARRRLGNKPPSGLPVLQGNINANKRLPNLLDASILYFPNSILFSSVVAGILIAQLVLFAAPLIHFHASAPEGKDNYSLFFKIFNFYAVEPFAQLIDARATPLPFIPASQGGFLIGSLVGFVRGVLILVSLVLSPVTEALAGLLGLRLTTGSFLVPLAVRSLLVSHLVCHSWHWAQRFAALRCMQRRRVTIHSEGDGEKSNGPEESSCVSAEEDRSVSPREKDESFNMSQNDFKNSSIPFYMEDRRINGGEGGGPEGRGGTPFLERTEQLGRTLGRHMSLIKGFFYRLWWRIWWHRTGRRRRWCHISTEDGLSEAGSSTPSSSRKTHKGPERISLYPGFFMAVASMPSLNLFWGLAHLKQRFALWGAIAKCAACYYALKLPYLLTRSNIDIMIESNVTAGGTEPLVVVPAGVDRILSAEGRLKLKEIIDSIALNAEKYYVYSLVRSGHTTILRSVGSSRRIRRTQIIAKQGVYLTVIKKDVIDYYDSKEFRDYIMSLPVY